MEGHMCLLFVICGVAVLGPWVSGSVLDVMVKPGDNITLYCDCTCPTGVYTVWYRNCSDPTHSRLVLKTKKDSIDTNDASKWTNPLPRFEFVKDSKSICFNLHITNITENDGGLYYCGTETTEVHDKNETGITRVIVHTYGKTTKRILFQSSQPMKPDPAEDGVCWILLFSLCPALTLLSTLLLMFVLYSECCKQDMKRAEPTVQMNQSEDGDVCYAALEIRQASQRPKRKKKTPDSDFCTYSAIKTSQE